MLYLVFGTLLILGAAVIGLVLYMSHKKNQIYMNVVENRCELERDAESIKRIRVIHELEFELNDEIVKVETDTIPVREIKDAKLRMYYDRENGLVYRPDFRIYTSVILAFVICGICCFIFYFLQGMILPEVMTEKSIFILFLSVIAVVAFSHLSIFVNPAIIKTKGNYEGVMCPEDRGIEEEVYSLWYGEHRQYTTRVKGMRVRHNTESPVILFYHTRTGVARRIHEIIISAVFGIAALTAIFVIAFI